MAFWKFKAWLHQWISRLISLVFIAGICIVVVYFTGGFKVLWGYLDRLMKTGMW